jgi:hypothetical protein
MKFDISGLDKAKVLLALYKHAFVRYDQEKNEDLELSYEEASKMIDHCTKNYGSAIVVEIDTIRGVPVKLFYDKAQGIVSSYSYDTVHGKYRYLYALVSEFGSDSIVVVSKKYPQYLDKPIEIDKQIMKEEAVQSVIARLKNKSP